MTWRERAACKGADPSIFFPERGVRLDAAREYCDRCEVRQQCLEEALTLPFDHVVGVWGSTSERQRQGMRPTPCPKPCAWCGEAFTPSRPDRLYCSERCKNTGGSYHWRRRKAS